MSKMTKKLKVYLDTNIIYGLIKEMARARLENRDYKKTKKLSFIQENLDIVFPITSFIALMESIENIKKDEPKLETSDLKKLISLFRKISKIKFLDLVKLSGESLKWVLSDISLKDSLHVNIAKNENLVFVSEDYGLIRKIKKFHNDSITFDELKKFIEKAK